MSQPTMTTRNNITMLYEGVAAEDLKENAHDLEIICPELLPHTTTGTLAAGITTGSAKLSDRDGNALKSDLTTANHFVATWEGSPGQRYPGMVRKGEPVEIFKRANQDKFYWRPTGRGRDFRKTDRMVVEIGASDPTKPGEEKTDDNTYSAYLDSDGKKVGIRTSKANGEVFALSMEADLAAGTFHISDDSEFPGNRIFIDTGKKSGVPAFHVNISSGGVIRLEKDDMYIKVPKKLLIDAGERIVFNSPIIVFNLKEVGAVIINAANIAFNGAKDLVIKSAAIGFNGATKVSGVLKAASANISNLVKGSVSGEHTGVKVDRPQESPVTTPSNSPDTGMDGPPFSIID